jgi:glycerol-3-phosphate dehydrogenase
MARYNIFLVLIGMESILQNKNKDQVFDVAIIGGGINGCGCAADAALRGLSVLLVEQGDIASKTSSKSSKLIHGGLRYLEHYDFGLVKKALNERQKLLKLAPHLVHPLAFVLPYKKNLRPAWLLRIGLFLYDHLSFVNRLPRSKFIRRAKYPDYFQPLFPSLDKGFLYYDCATDDARLTMANALQAKEHGATIMPQTTLTQANIIDGQWVLTLQNKENITFQLKAKTIINTAGPWVNNVSHLLNTPLYESLSFVKGSHIVTEKLYEGDQAYILQHDDQRIVFVIPYHGYSLIGTTDILFSGDLTTITIDDQEINYLFSVVHHYFNKELCEKNIITTWSGVRCLLSEANTKPSALSRDYVYHLTQLPAPAITVYGGKITTYRQLAVQVVDRLKACFPQLPASSTSCTPLPGATYKTMDFAAYKSHAEKKYHWLDKATRERYLETYGTRMEQFLAQCNHTNELGQCFGPTLYQVEVDYLIREEWALGAEDILWRRTQLGLIISELERGGLENYISSLSPAPSIKNMRK